MAAKTLSMLAWRKRVDRIRDLIGCIVMSNPKLYPLDKAIERLQTSSQEYLAFLHTNGIFLRSSPDLKLYLLPPFIHKKLTIEVADALLLSEDLAGSSQPISDQIQSLTSHMGLFHSLVELAAAGKITPEDASIYLCLATAPPPLFKVAHAVIGEYHANPKMTLWELNILLGRIMTRAELDQTSAPNPNPQLQMELELFGTEAAVGRLEAILAAPDQYQRPQAAMKQALADITRAGIDLAMLYPDRPIGF